MAEIEKKYLLRENGVNHFTEQLEILYPSIDSLVEDVTKNGAEIRQGYIPLDSGKKLAEALGMHIQFVPSEARLRDKAGKLYFTIKGDGGLERDEVESSIPSDIFGIYWKHTHGKRVEKRRLKKSNHGYDVEIDVYADRDLIVAEIEVPSKEEAQKLLPLGKDVTEDKRYKNKNLAK